jgi:outer membrane lipoprotein-sorting protein
VRYFSFATGLLATMVFAAACTLTARADAPSALRQALENSLKQTSYHMTMVSPTYGTIEADVAPPGRMHMLMNQKNMEVVVVDQTMYMKQNGAWRKYPGADFMKTRPNPLQTLGASKGKFTVDDLGPKIVDGAALHAYRVTNLTTKSVSRVFVDGSARIARIEVGSEVVQLSKFGAPVVIVAPM